MLEQESYGPVKALHQGRPLLGIFPPVMSVRCYAVDGLLIDTGLASFRKALLAWAGEQKVGRALITHHHEDHSGSAFKLKDADFEVLASQRTARWLEQGFSIGFYQKVVWGATRPVRPGLLPDCVQTDHYRFQVLPAPGHCDDQVVFFEADQGWLFSGDAFLAERIKYFRADENFEQTVASLESLCQLDFEQLFCAHHPRTSGGLEALKNKLQYLKDLEGKVRELHGRGYSPRAITRRLLGKEPRLIYLASLGDLGKINLVRSILFGPRRRRDVPLENREPADPGS